MLTRLSLLLFIVLLSAPVFAAVTVEMPLDDLIRNADVVVHGTVKVSKSFRNGEDSRINTEHTIEVKEYLKGTGETRIKVLTLGGEVGDFGQLVPGEARFKRNEEVVLCLVKAKDAYVVFSLAQGKFKVDRPEGKDPLLVRDYSGLLFVGEKGFTKPKPTRTIPFRTMRELIQKVTD
jgi:hypothetical protein